MLDHKFHEQGRDRYIDRIPYCDQLIKKIIKIFIKRRNEQTKPKINGVHELKFCKYWDEHNLNIYKVIPS